MDGDEEGEEDILEITGIIEQRFLSNADTLRPEGIVGLVGGMSGLPQDESDVIVDEPRILYVVSLADIQGDYGAEVILYDGLLPPDRALDHHLGKSTVFHVFVEVSPDLGPFDGRHTVRRRWSELLEREIFVEGQRVHFVC